MVTPLAVTPEIVTLPVAAPLVVLTVILPVADAVEFVDGTTCCGCKVTVMVVELVEAELLEVALLLEELQLL